jgi:glucan phosphoethanolaminetransferase (alkaline phosphatase superfamily)
MYHYRFAAHAFLITAALLMSWFILRARVWSPNFWHWMVLIFVIYSILNWFINILPDAAEGLQTSFMAERDL